MTQECWTMAWGMSVSALVGGYVAGFMRGYRKACNILLPSCLCTTDHPEDCPYHDVKIEPKGD